MYLIYTGPKSDEPTRNYVKKWDLIVTLFQTKLQFQWTTHLKEAKLFATEQHALNVIKEIEIETPYKDFKTHSVTL